MIAGNDDTRAEELIQYDKYRINRMSVICGPNGSGKTTLPDAILCAGKLMRNRMKQEAGDSFRKFSVSSLEALKDNRLFLACTANYTSIPDTEMLFFFSKQNYRDFQMQEMARSYLPSDL